MAGSWGLVKLFGKTIPVAPLEACTPTAPVDEGGGGVGPGGAAAQAGGGAVGGGNTKELQNHVTTTESQPKHEESPSSEEKAEQAAESAGSENHKPNPADQDEEAPKAAAPKEEQNNAGDPPEKATKKPDKILPCPRCNSMDTKFCYYNNYNVNQPRHFCKNCQRYWTAGGTMRNVPVGAGRRKSKHSAGHHRHITVSEAALHMVRPDITGQVHGPVLKANGTVLSFGSDMPFCESVTSVLNLSEKALHNCNRNGFHLPEEHIAPSCRGGGAAENGEEHSSGSSSNLTADGTNLQEPAIHNCQGYPPQVPCLNGTPWPSPWNPPSAFCVSSFPIPFYPTAAFWGCAVPSAWSVPLMAPLSSSSPNTPTLGKHAREEDVVTHSNLKKGDACEQTNGERCLWIPKTLRIDDPEEAAKSSIWAMVGVKNDKADRLSRGELFKAFDQPKAEIRSHAAETSKVLHANPAALSRSLNFLESM